MKNKILILVAFLFALAPAIYADGVDAVPPTASKPVQAPGDENIIRVEVRNTQRSAVRLLIDLQIVNPAGEVLFASLKDDPTTSRLQVRKAWFRQFKITPAPKNDPRWVDGEYKARLVLRNPKTNDIIWQMTGVDPVLFTLSGAVKGAIARKDTEAKDDTAGLPGDLTGGAEGVTSDDVEELGAALSGAFRDERINDIMDLISKNLTAGVTYGQAEEGLRQFFTNVSQINLRWKTDGVSAGRGRPAQARVRFDLQYFDPSSNRLTTREFSMLLIIARERDGNVRIVSGNIEQLTVSLPTVSVPGVNFAGGTPSTSNFPVTMNFGGDTDAQAAPLTVRVTVANVSSDATVRFFDLLSGTLVDLKLTNGSGSASSTSSLAVPGVGTIATRIAFSGRLVSSTQLELTATDYFFLTPIILPTISFDLPYFIINADGKQSNVAFVQYTFNP